MSFFKEDRLHTLPSRVYILVGVPRCGKSTKVREIYKHRQVTIVSKDDIRRSLGVQFDPKLENTVSFIHEQMIRSLLERGQNLLIDENNHIQATRKKLLNIIKEYNCEWYFEELFDPANKTKIELCFERAKATKFPLEVLGRFIKEFEPVQEEERYEFNRKQQAPKL